MQKVKDIFAADGPLANAISGFQPRQPQIDMALAVETAVKKKQTLLVEAGTGTGKTFAYLAPLFASHKKSIVSTGTKNLQEQLFHRDLPLVKKALGSHKKTALLKGRSNYLCLFRLRQHSHGNVFYDKQTLNELQLVKEWSNSTKHGDVGELDSIQEGAAILPYVTSTADNCLGRDCPDYESCYLVNARKDALDADLIVVNHHLFFADLALKDTGFGELVPEADCIVFDEAHQVPDIATEYFGESVSSRQIQELCKDIEMLQRTVLKDADQLTKAANKLYLLTADLRILLPTSPEKGNWREAQERDDIAEQIGKVQDAFDVLYEVVKVHLGREKALDQMFDRVSELRTLFTKLNETEHPGVSLWYETTHKHIILHLTPLSIAKRFNAIVTEPPRTWVFTSATISVDQDFKHIKRQLGLEDTQEMILPSPFDYPEQAMLCVPRYLPAPNHKEMGKSLRDIAVQLIEASQGRCFLLFTSHYMMRTVAELLEDEVDNTILVQGETSKRRLLDRYIEEKDAVLCATGSFWEGVDVRGNDLTCVMIDKLPFASPDDPLLQARTENCRKAGVNPFATLQIPQAVITLKQGAGRLIRDQKDKGVLVICDNRLVSKEYGDIFLRSLPNMKRTRDLKEVLKFLKDIPYS